MMMARTTTPSADQRGRRGGKAAGGHVVLIAAFHKGPETPGVGARILLKLRHAHDCSWSGRA